MCVCVSADVHAGKVIASLGDWEEGQVLCRDSIPTQQLIEYIAVACITIVHTCFVASDGMRCMQAR